MVVEFVLAIALIIFLLTIGWYGNGDDKSIVQSCNRLILCANPTLNLMDLDINRKMNEGRKLKLYLLTAL